ncbi:hypothetical protein, partial [Plasticicumulans sp.]|uniref:hypothetical protein n=1 Tax=Plasticicumulans sp. TaxID=2307179 RepID=UPI002CC0FBA0
RRGELDDAQCRLDGRAVVLPEFESVLAQARGENLPEPPAAEESGEAGEPDIGALLQSLDEPTLEALLQQIDAPEIRTAIRALWEHKSGSNDRADA